MPNIMCVLYQLNLMSVHVMAAVFSAGPTVPNQRYVLVKLADHASDLGVAWPSTKRIVADTMLSKATVNRCLRELQAAGWVSISRRGGGLAPAADRRNPQQYDPDYDGVSPMYQFSDRIMRIVRERLEKQEKRKSRSHSAKGTHGEALKHVTKGLMVSHPHTPYIEEPSTEPSPSPGMGATIPEEENPGQDFAMVASVVLSQCSLTGRDQRNVIEDIARLHIEAGEDASDLVRKMVEAYKRWKLAIGEGKLSFTWSVERFFKEDWWSDSSTWPWKTELNKTTAKARMIFD